MVKSIYKDKRPYKLIQCNTCTVMTQTAWVTMLDDVNSATSATQLIYKSVF